MNSIKPRRADINFFSDLYLDFRSKIPPNIEVLPAVKYGNAEIAAAFIQAGAQAIGENRVQDAIERKAELTQIGTPRYQTHLIGTLQRNKAKKAIQTVDCIQSIDRFTILNHLNTLGQQDNQTITGMIQINLGNEPNKSGFTVPEVRAELPTLCAFPNVQIVGIMVVAPHIDLCPDLRIRFREVRQLFDEACRDFPLIQTLSMGMSHDYQLAIDYGSTMIRVGSILYGL